jgi:hypothetical protein
VHSGAAGREYVPAGHSCAVALVDPAGHAYPAVQLPEQAAVVRPEVSPYVPAGHAPEHLAVLRRAASPNVPCGHRVQALEAGRLYLPTGQGSAVADTEAGRQ